MKLYSFPVSCAMACHIVLQWSGQPYDVQLIQREDLASDAIKALNPNGKVPILVDGDLTLTQNVAILNYLADRFPDANLAGQTAQERALTNNWLCLINSDLHPAYPPFFGSTAYLGDEAVIKQTQANASQRIRAYYERIDAHLAGRDYLTGQRSVADAYLFVTTLWAAYVKLDISDLTNLAAHTARMRSDKDVQHVLQVNGLG